MIEVGKPAPRFTLPDQDGNKVALTALRGEWIVLYFYPQDSTPGCTVEACEFSGSIEEFSRLGARVLGCSPDPPASHRDFIAKYCLALTLLSDRSKRVMTKYGAWGEKTLYGRTSIGAIRSTVIIDPNGKIAHRWKSVQTKGHSASVRKRLAAIQG